MLHLCKPRDPQLSVTVITPPTALITLAEAKAHLRADDDFDDAYVTSLIAVAQGTIDGPDGWLGRSIGVQTLEMRSPAFVSNARQGCPLGLALGCGPVINVVSIAYRDGDGAVQVVDPANYEIDDDTLIPAQGFYWPVPASRPNAVRVRYRAGYPDRLGDGEATVSTVPAPILHALKIMIGLLYDGRSDAADLQTHGAIASLLGPYRHWRC